MPLVPVVASQTEKLPWVGLRLGWEPRAQPGGGRDQVGYLASASEMELSLHQPPAQRTREQENQTHSTSYVADQEPGNTTHHTPQERPHSLVHHVRADEATLVAAPDVGGVAAATPCVDGTGEENKSAMPADTGTPPEALPLLAVRGGGGGMAGDDGTGGVAAEGVGVRVMPLNMSNACVAGDADPTDAADAADAARPGTGGGTDAVGTPPSEDAMNENPLPALAAEATETPRPCKVGVAADHSAKGSV